MNNEQRYLRQKVACAKTRVAAYTALVKELASDEGVTY
jgi:hypothetical protein